MSMESSKIRMNRAQLVAFFTALVLTACGPSEKDVTDAFGDGKAEAKKSYKIELEKALNDKDAEFVEEAKRIAEETRENYKQELDSISKIPLVKVLEPLGLSSEDIESILEIYDNPPKIEGAAADLKLPDNMPGFLDNKDQLITMFENNSEYAEVIIKMLPLSLKLYLSDKVNKYEELVSVEFEPDLWKKLGEENAKLLAEGTLNGRRNLAVRAECTELQARSYLFYNGYDYEKVRGVIAQLKLIFKEAGITQEMPTAPKTIPGVDTNKNVPPSGI